MHLQAYRIRNFRKLQDVTIELASDISIFVGCNNSGKTSATQALGAFVSGSKSGFSLYDFSSRCWTLFDSFGKCEDTEQRPELPSMSLDLWFEVREEELHLVIPLLPSTNWEGTQVGIRIELAARNPEELLANYRDVSTKAQESASSLPPPPNGTQKYVPWPKSMSDYLKSRLLNEFEFKYYVLDRTRFDSNYKPQAGHAPPLLDKESNGSSILKSLIKIDNLNAQRYLADPSHSQGGGRSEDLSKRLSRFYKRNLDQRQDDHQALRALFDSETGLNEHLADVFKDTLTRLSDLGYPGFQNPRLEIKSALNPATIMSSQDARVHYVVGDGDNALRLPDTYNGLGFKNLIYMVVEILDIQARWAAEVENRAPLHLIFIEEPEAHLHVQLQQVFIRNVLSLINDDNLTDDIYVSQVVVTTHSPHILYERGFQPIRYFRRHGKPDEQTTQVLNLSEFYSENAADRDFLERYLKLTHCDLFFADAAILVEGNVERLLLPVMIEKSAPKLRSACLSVLEVGGAFAHRFRRLIEFLGLVALVITDLDSVTLLTSAEEKDEEEEDATEFEVPGSDTDEPVSRRAGKACLPSAPDARTSNQTLIQWLPKLQTVSELLDANDAAKVQEAPGGNGFKVRVTYQVPTDVQWKNVTKRLTGRTLEEAFGLENATWCQELDQKDVGLRFPKAPLDPESLASKLHKRISGKAFDKTKFALGVLTKLPNSWRAPRYIEEGLIWLEEEVRIDAPVKLPDTTGPDELVASVVEVAEALDTEMI